MYTSKINIRFNKINSIIFNPNGHQPIQIGDLWGPEYRKYMSKML